MKIREKLRQTYCYNFLVNFLWSIAIVGSVCNLIILSVCSYRYFKDYLEWPVEIWIDDRFNNEEEQDIRWVFGEWERSTKRDLFTYKGRHIDHKLSTNDRFDRKNVIYKIEASTKFSRLKEAICPNRILLGIGQERNDTLIFHYNFLKAFPSNNNTLKTRRYFFKKIVMHELGHFLGLDHVDREDLLMHKYILGNPEEPLEITEDDLEPFFKIHDKRFKLITPKLTKGR